MFFLNLSLPEFLLIFGAVSGAVVTLYLLSRARRRQVVPTLRFWVHATQPVPSSRRRRIQQPWSLLLQLLSLALLLLAVAQLRLGNRETSQRNHVLLLDTSSWMGASSGPGRTLLDEAKTRARSFVRSLAPTDRVMLVRVDGLPSPATGMETNRETIERAIDETRAGASALNLDQAFLFAEQIRRLHDAHGGEIVYAGSGRVSGAGVPVNTPANLRVLPVDGPTYNVGLASVGARRSDVDPEQWEIFVSVRNYGPAPRKVPLTVQFGPATIGSTVLTVGAGATDSYTLRYRTRAAGWIEARLLLQDGLTDDNRTILELPALKLLQVAVYTDRPDSIRPILAAHPQVRASYHPPTAYRGDKDAQVVIADRFAPSPEPKVPTIYLQPPAGSPFRTTQSFRQPQVVRWRSEHPITAGIRTRDQRVPAGEILTSIKGDTVLGEVAAGPIALVRPDKRAVALGFNPGETDLRFDLTTPLLLANMLRWMEPEFFRTAEVHGSSVGAVTVPLEAGTDPKTLRVTADGQPLPFTTVPGAIRFFSGAPGVVRVLSGSREEVYSLSLPEVGDKQWTPPQTARRGVPGFFAQAASRDMWQILATLGALGLLTEWLLYGRRRAVLAPATPGDAGAEMPAWRKAS